MNTIDLNVQGMRCGGCVRHVTQTLQALPGFGSVDVDLSGGRVRLSGEFAQGGEAAIAALSAAGYPAQLTASAVAAPPPRASGCQSGRGAQGGCCCG